MKSIKLIINTKTKKYPIFIGSDLLTQFSNILKKNSIKFSKCLLIIDKNIKKNKISQLLRSLKNKKVYIYKFNASEINKSQKSVNKILDILINKNFNRDDCLISLGGGITGDVGGYASSIFKRGLKFINVPTTLLSQVDSSIGGKTGINTQHGKNLIGSFYQPILVISDTTFLKTLPVREIVCGYAEILKHSLIKNEKFFKFLDNQVFKILKLESPYIEKAIFESCKIKKYVVEKDEKEKSLRKILNFGHTFGHAFESTMAYSKKLNHGEAVILGMSSALKFSFQNHKLDKKHFQKIKNHLKKAKLPNNLNYFFGKKDVNKIVSFMTKDKKNTSDKINLILLKKIGSANIKNQFSQNYIRLFLKKELSN